MSYIAKSFARVHNLNAYLGFDFTESGISVCSLQRTPSVTVQRKQPINPAKAAANKSSEKAANKSSEKAANVF